MSERLHRWQLGNLIVLTAAQAIPIVAAWVALKTPGGTLYAAYFLLTITLGEAAGFLSAVRAVNWLGERIMLFVCSVLMTLSFSLLSLGISWANVERQTILIVAAVVIQGICTGWLSPIFQQFISRFSPPSSAAYEMQRTVRFNVLASIIGPAAAASYLSTSPLGLWTFVTFGGSLLACLCFLPFDFSPEISYVSATPESPPASPSFLTGVRIFRTVEPARSLMILGFMANISLYAFFALIVPAIVARANPPRPWMIGVIDNVFCISGFLAGSFVAKLTTKKLGKKLSITLAVFLIGVTFISFSALVYPGLGIFANHPRLFIALAFVLMIVGGSFTVSVDMTMNPLIVLAVPDNARLPFMQFAGVVQRIIMMVTMWASGAVMLHAPPYVMCGLMGGTLVSMAIIFYLSSKDHPILSLPDGEIRGAYARYFPATFGTGVGGD